LKKTFELPDLKQYGLLVIATLGYTLLLEVSNIYTQDWVAPEWIIELALSRQMHFLLWDQIKSTLTILCSALIVALFMIVYLKHRALKWSGLPALMAALPLALFALQSELNLSQWVFFSVYVDSLKRFILLPGFIFLYLYYQKNFKK